ncbi:hypothetical protein ACS0TY_024273 [Phlomoides rotata]
MKEKSWVCTLITQLSLCMIAYIAINIGQPQKLTHEERSANDIYFISVAGGFRPLEEQTLLLQQMVKVKKMFKARFVVGFSEVGESDPLIHNATFFPALRNMPWYTAGAMEGQGQTYFLKTIETPYGQILDIIALDTVSLQDQSRERGNDQIVWLRRTLNESKSDWKIVVGLHQLITTERLHNILLQYGVDAYMSLQLQTGALDKGPYLTPINHNLVPKEETVDGFLLHQITSLEMVTLAVKVRGGVKHILTFQHKGKAVM